MGNSTINNGDYNSVPLVEAVPAPSAPSAPTMYPTGNYSSDNSFIVPTPRQGGNWNIELMDKCCSPSAYCCIAWCCSCFPLAQIAGRVENMTVGGYETRGKKYQMVFYSLLLCFLISFIFGVNLLAIAMMIFLYMCRAAIRSLYRIEGSVWKDLAISCCCTPCSILQMSSQIWETPELVACDISERPIHWGSERPFRATAQELNQV